jgi:hypothetical protein
MASNAARKFMSAVAAKTPDHPTLETLIRLASGTSSDATPFAT